MIILGIDPGYAILGYGVLEADGRKVRPLDYGVVETKVGTPFPERLDMLYAGVNELLRLYKPDCAVFEELFFYHNATTAIQVGAGRGVAKLAGPLAMAYSEPSIRPKISQIIWLRYFCSAARIALMDIATPASTPNPSVHSPGNTASCRPIRLMLLESSGTLPKKIFELYPV